MYGCETWSFTLSEEQRLRVFENKMLRNIFEARRNEITGVWRKLHNAELHALRRRRVIGISGSLIWSKTLMELIFNPCGEFR